MFRLEFEDSGSIGSHDSHLQDRGVLKMPVFLSKPKTLNPKPQPRNTKPKPQTLEPRTKLYISRSCVHKLPRNARAQTLHADDANFVSVELLP